MTRDPALEAKMLHDLGYLADIASKAMFGGLCYMLNGHMLCAAREGRAMYRVGPEAEDKALAFPGTEPMIHGGHAKRGFIWLSGDPLENDSLRGALAQMSLEFVSHLPAKDA